MQVIKLLTLIGVGIVMITTGSYSWALLRVPDKEEMQEMPEWTFKEERKPSFAKEGAMNGVNRVPNNDRQPKNVQFLATGPNTEKIKKMDSIMDSAKIKARTSGKEPSDPGASKYDVLDAIDLVPHRGSKTNEPMKLEDYESNGLYERGSILDKKGETTGFWFGTITFERGDQRIHQAILTSIDGKDLIIRSRIESRSNPSSWESVVLEFHFSNEAPNKEVSVKITAWKNGRQIKDYDFPGQWSGEGGGKGRPFEDYKTRGLAFTTFSIHYVVDRPFDLPHKVELELRDSSGSQRLFDEVSIPIIYVGEFEEYGPTINPVPDGYVKEGK